MPDNKTYFLNLSTLLTYLHSQSCELTTELDISGERVRGSLVLKYGKIVNCTLTFSHGRQITGEQAYQQLQNSSRWQVRLEQRDEKVQPFPPTQFSPSMPPLPTPSTPAHDPWNTPPLRPLRPLDPALLQNLSVKERLLVRSVYMLVNGKNSIEQIKSQLHLSPQSIDAAIAVLRMFDVIE
ncbi:MAG: hypothetical protein ACRDHZ_15760 [Ktedonobacteraceae bacterium]